MLITETSTGTTNGAPCVESGPIIKAEDVPNYNTSVQTIRGHIRNLTPFECSDWDALCSAIIHEYDSYSWNSDLIWLLGCIRSMQQFKKNSGSWNVPIRTLAFPKKERECYKVFRQTVELKNNIFVKEYRYEFHNGPIAANTWMQAEISGSPGLSGIVSPEQAKFHMLFDKAQADAYLYTRTESSCGWISKPEAVVKKVIGRNFTSIDLIYVPPKMWVWGIDATEMYFQL